MNKLDLANTLKRIVTRKKDRVKNFFVGFDGFVDEITTLVDKRVDASRFVPMQTIEQFANRVKSAKRKSTNIELVTKDVRLGGNGPILAKALVLQGHLVHLVGALGLESIHPVFTELYTSCKTCVSIANPGLTDAVEFQDGKILFGKIRSVADISIEQLLTFIPKNRLQTLIDKSDVIALVNWTMIQKMNEIWEYLLTSIIPSLSKKPHRWFFFDLADPIKREEKDLDRALMLLSKMAKWVNVSLGLNEKEAEIVFSTLFSKKIPTGKNKLVTLCEEIRKKLKLQLVVIHAIDKASCASAEQNCQIAGPFCKNPFLSTGAGDNFNAGFCQGLAFGLSLEHALLLAVTCSGIYVRTGTSPSVEECISFLEAWHKKDPQIK